MKIYALDKTNIDDFNFLVEYSAAEAIKRDEAYGFCVKEKNAHVGALVGRFVDEKEFEIMSLYVVPEARRKGVGEKLLDTLVEVLDEKEANLSITFACVSDSDKDLCAFLEKMEFDEYKSLDSHMFSVTVGMLANSKIAGTKPGSEFISFNNLTKKQLSALEKVKSKGYVPRPSGGFTSQAIEADMSIAYFEKDKPMAYVVVEHENDDLLMLSSLYVHDPDQPTTLLKLLKSLAYHLTEKYTDDTVLLIPTVTDSSERLVTSLFGENPEINDILYTYRKYIPGNDEINYDDMSLTEFFNLNHEEYYDATEGNEGAYLIEADSISGE
ncbi:MAG: GNAT family N-acetyltransferase [Lachnospiraceae bacterium]|nr:GNAT family N-acetyltransferase [Lachnospiraceae bacterium]